MAWRVANAASNSLRLAQQEWLGDREAERFGCSHVDDKIKLGRLLDRDVTRLRPAQNLVDEVASAPVEAREVRSIGNETPRFEPYAVDEYCG
jgi:hypothetical protein